MYLFLKLLKHLKIIYIILILYNICYSQENTYVPSDQRGDPKLRRKAIMDGNNVRVSVFNFGLTGGQREDPESVPFEWPKNTNRIYVYFSAVWLGGEVKDEDGKIINIVDVPNWRESPSGSSWNLEPVPGFVNPYAEEVARSDDPDTWPIEGWRDKKDDPIDPGWIGSWNGFFGKNIFNADQEIFYRTSDDLYKKRNYVPDETDPTRGGLGLLMDVRVLAWSQIFINDVIFIINDIKNDGTKRIPKSSFLIWLADLVGGDYIDDEPFIDLQTSTAFLTDADRIGDENFGSDPVGVGSIKFIETPGNQVDGIDNDGDSDSGQNRHLQLEINGDPDERIPQFTADDFLPRNLRPGDKIVLIDSLTYKRRTIEYPVGGGKVKTLGKMFDLPKDGITLKEETVPNLVDDDLDGLIDELSTLHLERFDEITGTVTPVRYINYLSFEPGDTIKRGFIVPGKDAVPSYRTVAPMIDEARDDGFDNDRDWYSFQDDVGMDGVENTGDPGEGDNIPTSGAGTEFPGEPNIDKTDVAETDLIGLTSAIRNPEGGLNFNTTSDEHIWQTFLTPGNFDLQRGIVGQYDTFVSSGYFPLEPGQRQRIAVSIAMAGGGIDKSADIQNALKKQKQAYLTYESDYQFARAPNQVTVTAVPGDRKVTLYWDDVAEFSEDRFIKRMGGDYRDFEGYRVYRATDAAFLDAKVITDAEGVATFLKPIAQFDLKDGIKGLHSVDINGVKFDLGDDTGIVHSFTDTNLVNGQRYFYAVTAYDFGYTAANISPTETPIRVSVDPQGNIETGSNVALVRPRAPVAGYIPAEVVEFEHMRGGATGKVAFKIIDPRAVKDGHVYEITFEDTLIQGRVTDTLITKSFTVTDISDGLVRLNECNKIKEGDEIPSIDGFQLFLFNDISVRLNEDFSGWTDSEVYPFEFKRISFLSVQGKVFPNDYQLIIGNASIAVSKDTTIDFMHLAAKEVNFKVINKSIDKPVEFAFAEIDGKDGRFTIDPKNANKTDTIFLLEKTPDGKLVFTWQIILNLKIGGRNPEPGDTLNVVLHKPFLSPDLYRFKIKGESESKEIAKNDLSDIRVVPNPYIAAEVWEPRNPYTSGRGPREIHFINLPRKCTIRIFNVNGVLVDQIEHDTSLDNGTAIWDVLSKDSFEISYGIYLYYIEAPGIGKKTGTFAIIK